MAYCRRWFERGGETQLAPLQQAGRCLPLASTDSPRHRQSNLKGALLKCAVSSSSIAPVGVRLSIKSSVVTSKPAMSGRGQNRPMEAVRELHRTQKRLKTWLLSGCLEWARKPANYSVIARGGLLASSM
jgi:hypothetical protein